MVVFEHQKLYLSIPYFILFLHLYVCKYTSVFVCKRSKQMNLLDPLFSCESSCLYEPRVYSQRFIVETKFLSPEEPLLLLNSLPVLFIYYSDLAEHGFSFLHEFLTYFVHFIVPQIELPRRLSTQIRLNTQFYSLVLIIDFILRQSRITVFIYSFFPFRKKSYLPVNYTSLSYCFNLWVISQRF